MTDVGDPILGQALANLSVPGILVGHRLIAPEDASALTPEETASFPSPLAPARRASGAARIIARDLLAQMGLARCPLPKGPSGAAIWPAGVVGSLAHDDRVAVAAVARRTDIGALGVDVEPAGALPDDLVDVVATAREKLVLDRDPDAGRLLFAAKEAVYKAINPLDGMFLEFHDIQVDLASSRATLRDGRGLRLALVRSTHAVALAYR